MGALQSIQRLAFRLLLTAFTGAVLSAQQPVKAQERITLDNSLHSTDDSARIFGLVRQGLKVLETNTDSALGMFKKAETISRKRHFSGGIGYALSFMGLAEAKRGNFETGLRYFENALPYCLQAIHAPYVLGFLYKNIASSYVYQGDFPKARTYFQQSLSCFEKYLPDSSTPFAIYVSLAGIQSRMGSYEKALQYADYVISHAKGQGNKKFLASGIRAKGSIFYTMDKPDLAMQYYRDGLNLAFESGDPGIVQAYFLSMGNVLLKKKQYEEAIGYFREAIRMNTAKTEPLQGYILPRYSLGSALLGAGKYKEAERVLVDALKKAQETGLSQNLTDGHGVLSMVYLHMGALKKSLDHIQQYVVLKDSLNKIEKIRAINEIDARYQVAQKDKALIQQELQIARQQERIRNKNLLLGGTAGGIGLLIFLGMAIYGYRQKIKSRELEIDRLKARIAGEERERARISKELHDGLGGTLTGIKLNLRTLQKQTAPEKLPESLEEIMRMLQNMGEELHVTAHNLMPEVLQKQSLRKALELYCGQLQTGELELQLQFHNDPNVPDKTRELAIYRILQELIQNIVKHAAASLAVIQIGKNGSLLCISAEDNGVGFDATQPHNGLGLENIRVRVEALNGYYALSSIPGRGTTVHIEIDLK